MSLGRNSRAYASRRVWIPRFNLESNIKFIEEYRKHPCLWDPGDPQYMKHAPRFRSYEEIARSMNYPGLDAASVRSKIKILRSCYISSRKQIASKAGTSTPHKPVDWFWAADSFLHDVIRLGFSEPKDIGNEYRYLKAQFDTPINQNSSASEAEIYFGSDMPVSSTVEVIEEQANYVEEEMPQSQPVKPVNVKTEVVEETRLGDNSIYLELDDEQLMAIENGEMSIEDVTARAEAAASQHQQQVARDRSMKADRMNMREGSRKDEEEEERSRTNEEEETEDEFDAFECTRNKELGTDIAKQTK
ncbi:hypothetical protein GE061_017748 [Apolygus lucorum]|uniref:MADF domain-containing protein n=1 Tax=Apolygus lucorum TaxID=248454 RepID=A0A8S9XFW1_APOLU|nr:hypothetical protein GE061_017748 [Apolygus lucorum]